MHRFIFADGGYRFANQCGQGVGIRTEGDMMDERKQMGRDVKDVIIPIAPLESEMDARYFELRDFIVTRIKETRLRFVIQANEDMIGLYWNIGNDILQRQKSEGWGAKVIDRLSYDLKKEFPEMSGFSSRNLRNMKLFASTWTDSQIWQQAVAKLQWRSILILIAKLRDNESREWYTQKGMSGGRIILIPFRLCFW